MAKQAKTPLDPAKIHILDFRIIEGKINSPFDFDESGVNSHEFKLGFDLGFNLKQKHVKSDFQIEIITKSSKENKNEASGFFHFIFLFQIENLEQLAKQNSKDSLVEMHGALGNALASITYSTSRGILLTRFNGTALQRFILPVINPDDLLDAKLFS